MLNKIERGTRSTQLPSSKCFTVGFVCVQSVCVVPKILAKGTKHVPFSFFYNEVVEKQMSVFACSGGVKVKAGRAFGSAKETWW